MEVVNKAYPDAEAVLVVDFSNDRLDLDFPHAILLSFTTWVSASIRHSRLLCPWTMHDVWCNVVLAGVVLTR